MEIIVLIAGTYWVVENFLSKFLAPSSRKEYMFWLAYNYIYMPAF